MVGQTYVRFYLSLLLTDSSSGERLSEKERVEVSEILTVLVSDPYQS